jgi:hypothetical protein
MSRPVVYSFLQYFLPCHQSWVRTSGFEIRSQAKTEGDPQEEVRKVVAWVQERESIWRVAAMAVSKGWRLLLIFTMTLAPTHS